MAPCHNLEIFTDIVTETLKCASYESFSNKGFEHVLPAHSLLDGQAFYSLVTYGQRTNVSSFGKMKLIS